ncbi:protein SPIRRIG-like isoform X1 [Macadamia integrifolia]|uniref:protein SPIRRIG-like isoform X1 n=1 Tax=Macadamia integrifolia TaxID=60698 RepID=UPI001C4F03AE|nr:protein SPIRRIG-like isoform X1 [Macadamia integrifolia]
MFQSSRKTMKWSSLLKDLKEKVGLSPHSTASSSSPFAAGAEGFGSPRNAFAGSPSRDKHELELDFKRFWEEFRSSSSEKEKEMALDMAIDVFCRLVKQHSNVAQVVSMLIETHIFSFVVGRAFVTDIEKLKIISKTRSLDVVKVMRFFTDIMKDGISPGSNLLHAIEVLVSGPIDKQSLLDSGILCCLIHILNALLSPDEANQRHLADSSEENLFEKGYDGDIGQVRRLEVEGSIVHIMKALASHPSAAQSLIEDDSLHLLFEMVATGSLIVFSRFKQGLVPLHTIQLHRHAMQILGLLLVNDNGSTAKYIHNHHLIKVLLMAVKDFNPEYGDSAYTLGIVDLLLECVELSYRPEAGGISLREDIHNAHGYHFLVQFALVLSNLQKNQDSESIQSQFASKENSASDGSLASDSVGRKDFTGKGWATSPALARLLDVLVNLAQTGPSEPNIPAGGKGAKSSPNKAGGHVRTRTSSDEMWEKRNAKIKDLEAIQMLQDIFLKADSTELRAEVLNRMFKIFSSHLENYMLCQQLRTVPLFILNMTEFPPSLQEIILKILEYAVTVVNCIPEQELLSLCCLLQQPITSELKHTILSFFVKLLSFDQQYKKVLREVGVLEVILDDLKQHRFLSRSEKQNKSTNPLEKKSGSSSFKQQMDSKDAIISSPKLMESVSAKFPLFETENTIAVAWDCMVSLLKKAEANQSSFRSSNGVTIILPFLVSDIHRPGVLRTLSCLIIEDVAQAHPEELGSLVEVLKSGMVTSVSGTQYKLQTDAKCDTFGALWRILGVNNLVQRVFGEATGFSLLLTTLHSFQSDEAQTDGQSLLLVQMKLFTFLLRVMTAGVCGNAVNRTRLHTVLSSQTFYDLLSESGLLCVDCEKQVIQLLLELALEMVLPPSSVPTAQSAPSSDLVEAGSVSFLLSASSGSFIPYKESVYNASAISILIRSLLYFTPKVQIEVLSFIEKLAQAGPFNQESLTSVGCVGLLLETIRPFLASSSPLLSHALQIVQVLGAYRLSSLELRVLVRYILQMRMMNSGHILVDMMERLVHLEDTSENVSLAPFVVMDMSKVGHSSIQASLGERSWPPAAGYSFVCWFQYHNLLKPQAKDPDQPFKAGASKRWNPSSTQKLGAHVLRLFSVGAVDDENTFYAELYLQDDGVLTLATSSSSSLSFSGLDLEEGRWYHLAVVHSKPNALAGLFQASVAYVYVNGKLRHTGKLGYSPSPFGKSLQVTIGTPATCAKVCQLSWRLCCCYLFEDVLTSGSICFMYILGRGYRGLFQDTDLLQFVPNQACGGGNMAILDALDAEYPLVSNAQKVDNTSKQGNPKADGSGIVWDLERLVNLSSQLSGKKLIFAFNGTSSEALQTSGTLSLLNLVDPLSAAASPIGGIPRFGRLHGDIYICRQCVIGDTIQTVGGMAVVLAVIEASETRDMLHMSLSLLACALHQSPQNVRDMQAYRGYHLLALFLHRRMSLFDMQCLEIFCQIAACEASFSEPQKLQETHTIPSPAGAIHDANNYEDLNLSKFPDEFSSVGSHGDLDDFSVQKDSFSHISELENADLSSEPSNCIVLSNADMVEHVLLDWTLWVMAPVPIQIALLGFLERLVSMHWYRSHNLTVLRRMNLVQHLLVTLQRGDVEVPVLEKLTVLLGVILEDGLLTSELEHVVRFVIMTFDPPELKQHHQIIRESMGKHVIVRNMLLEMLIDLQVTLNSEELLEPWHKIVSSKLITYFLDESVHPTSMKWIMTLLGVCLASSPTFSLKFRSIGGYQNLACVLPSFYDSPEIYYILFCLIFGKPVYPRVPEVRMLDFHALMPSDGSYGELKFVELLESVIAMSKSTFDRLSVQAMLAHETGNHSLSGSLVAELVEGTTDMAGELQGEALMHKTYAARLMGGEAAAPAAATAVLRFMVDLAKMCSPFSAVCRRAEFLESCIDLYFSCVRAACAVKMAKDLSLGIEEKNLNDSDDTHSSQHTFSSLPPELEQSVKTSISVGSFQPGQVSTSSEGIPEPENYLLGDKTEGKTTVSQRESSTQFIREDGQTVHGFDGESVDQMSTVTSSINEYTFPNVNGMADSASSLSFNILDSPILSEKSTSKVPLTPSSAPVIALASWIGSTGNSEGKSPVVATPSIGSSVSMGENDASQDLKSSSQGSSAANTFLSVNPKLLLEMDESGYGGGPCSAGATAVLDFMAKVLADIVTEQVKAAPVIESILETVPLYVDAETVLVFQGLCLSRLMNFLEGCLLRDDEEDEKKLDKNRWSVNLDALCWMIVDRVYMGAFPEPGGILRTLEFLLSMLQLANKDGRIEEAAPTGKGLLPITRASRQLDTYIHALLKNMNRMIMYCFLPLFLTTIGEDDLLSCLGLQMESKKSLSSSSSQESGIDICTVLQLLVAHKRIIFCPSNLDTDLNCCLCINLISLLQDRRQNAQNIVVDIFKYMLVHRRAALEELLVSKPNQGQHLDVLHGGFDKLLTGSSSVFFEWLQSSGQMVNKLLEQCAAIMWVQYIAGSAKFPGVRIKGMEGRRKREIGRRSRNSLKIDQKHWDQVNERRYALELVRDAMATELRAVRQDKYGWVLNAESEWQTHLQRLVHERGIFPMRKSTFSEEPELQLCPIEGPYRMRKKLERCKLKIATIQNVLNEQFELAEAEQSKGKNENSMEASETDSDSFFHLLSHGSKEKSFDGGVDSESLFKETDDVKEEDEASARVEWNEDLTSNINDGSLYSAGEFGVKSSTVSIPITDGIHGKSDLGSPGQTSSVKIDDTKVAEDKLEKELLDSGEYLIRPYLEPLEKIRFRYNCERVVGLDKHDGVFLIGELCLYVIENFYIDDSECICEKECEDGLSVIDQALGVKKDVTGSMEFEPKSPSLWSTTARSWAGARAWAYNGGAWGKEKVCTSGNLPHPWRMWKLDNVHEILKRDYQLRPVAVEIFSMDGCNDLLVFHKKEREEVFKNLVAMNLPRNNMLDTTISGSSKQEGNEGSRLFNIMAKSFSKRWQNGEISNFQYLMHLNTLAGRGYSDLTQYPVFPWVLADYESETLDLSDPTTYRKMDKPMGCQTDEREDEFKKRYESWDDPDVPKFHYGSHYSSAGIVLFYLVRLPPFSAENQKLQGGQFDHADRLFNNLRDTWLSAAGNGNTSDVKELIPELFYMPEFLENRFNLELGEKQSGEKVGDVVLPPWAKGSAREFIRKHREALESDYVSEHLHHWIDLIFGYKQRGKAAEEAVNVFYHYTYEGSVDIDSVTDPAMKASILAQINHFGQTPKQLFLKPHVKRRVDRKLPPHPLRHCNHLVPHEIRKSSSPITQIVTFHEKILLAGTNQLLKPRTYAKYVAWGFPDCSLRFMSYDQDRLLSTHESLHGGHQIQCAGVSHDGRILVTGADDGLVSVWRISEDGPRSLRRLNLERPLCAHTAKITCVYVSQPYMLILSGSDDCSIILWDLSTLVFVKQLPEFPAPVSAIYVNDLTGEIVTAAGVLLAVWSINCDCLAVVNTSQLPSDFILSVTSAAFSDWQDTNWYITGHQSGAVKVWHMVHCSDETSTQSKSTTHGMGGLGPNGKVPEYRLVLRRVLKYHKYPVTALHLTSDKKQLLSGDSGGHLSSWTLPDESLRDSVSQG